MWLYQGSKFTNILDDYVGFVYLITSRIDGKKYLGKKIFNFTTTKTKKNKRRKTIKESDWKEYWGSNKKLHEDILKYGKENFHREILVLCKSKSELSYYETLLIFYSLSLQRNDFYNDFVSCKINKRNLQKTSFLDRKELNVLLETIEGKSNEQHNC